MGDKVLPDPPRRGGGHELRGGKKRKKQEREFLSVVHRAKGPGSTVSPPLRGGEGTKTTPKEEREFFVVPNRARIRRAWGGWGEHPSFAWGTPP
jgi:hypothetical protein